MCGGTLLIHPCSHVGHVFRATTPHEWPGGNAVRNRMITRNTVRTIMVWTDEWQSLLFGIKPSKRLTQNSNTLTPNPSPSEISSSSPEEVPVRERVRAVGPEEGAAVQELPVVSGERLPGGGAQQKRHLPGPGNSTNSVLFFVKKLRFPRKSTPPNIPISSCSIRAPICVWTPNSTRTGPWDCSVATTRVDLRSVRQKGPLNIILCFINGLYLYSFLVLYDD